MDNTNGTLARWHERVIGNLLAAIFNISRFFVKTLAGLLNFSYLCNIK